MPTPKNNVVLVKRVQEFLNLKADGIYGPLTTKAVMNYQRVHNLVADGIIGPKTLESMGILDSDLTGTAGYTANGIFINKHYLPTGEYVDEGGLLQNDYVFLHHTAGWNNPYAVVDAWASDKNGKVGAEFVIGGVNIKNGDAKYDGEVVQAFPEGNRAAHLGNTGNPYMTKHSVGIEMCNFGYIVNNKTYTGQKCDDKYICTLNEKFRGYDKYQKYTDAQLWSLNKLLLYVAARDNINIREGLVKWIDKEGIKAFEYHEEAFYGKVKGLLTHANVRKDKFDVFPQPELIDMLKML